MESSASDPTIPSEQSKLLMRLLGVFAISAVALSFLEADRRGLLFDTDPVAFSVSEGAIALTGPSVIRFGHMQSKGKEPRFRSVGRGPASRLIPGRGARIGQSGSGGSDQRVGGAPPDPALIPSPPQGSPGQPSSPTGGLPNAGLLSAPRLGQSVPGTGFAPSPIGFVPGPSANQPPVTPPPGTINPDPDPVVPAIPEPASWLLMILGLGWIGIYLRRQTTFASHELRS